MRIDDVRQLRLAEVVYPFEHPQAGQKGVVLAYAIPHPLGCTLVDTGIGEGNEELDEFYQVKRRPLADALGEAGYRLGDVRDIIVSHLHFDHCGNCRLFPGVPIHVQREELRLARTTEYTVREWVDFAGAVYREHDGEERIGPGVRVMPTPVHTPGHQSVVVDCEDGRLVLAGHARPNELRDLAADVTKFSHDEVVVRKKRQ